MNEIELMKTSIKLILLALGLFALNANAANPTFNHKGIQKGATSSSCYRNPCSVVKVMDFKLLKNKPAYRLIKLKVVGGTQGWDSKKTIWNHDFHDLYITCSLKNPSVKIGDQTTIIPINREEGVPGVLYFDSTIYLQACHNFDGDSTDAAKKYGYNVKEF